MEVTRGSFSKWLQGAKPGDNYVYKTGQYLTKTRGCRVYSEKVWDAREAFERGEVDLVQKRLSVGAGARFAWIAIKREKVKPPPPSYSVDGQIASWGKRPKAA